MAQNTLPNENESLDTTLARKLANELSSNETHSVIFGEGHNAGEIMFGIVNDSGFVHEMAGPAAGERAWQGGAAEMRARFKKQVEAYIDGLLPEFDDTLKVVYDSAGAYDPVDFDFEREAVELSRR